MRREGERRGERGEGEREVGGGKERGEEGWISKRRDEDESPRKLSWDHHTQPIVAQSTATQLNRSTLNIYCDSH